MRLTITIDMDNAAFHNGPEAGRILSVLAETVDDMQPGDSVQLFDLNGNTVGKAEVTK